MKGFIDTHINKFLGVAGALGVFQFIGELCDYLADGELDTHEIQQLYLSTASAIQTLIIGTLFVYFRYFKKK